MTIKALVFGAGVIGGQLAHALSLSGNDVTAVALILLVVVALVSLSLIRDRKRGKRSCAGCAQCHGGCKE